MLAQRSRILIALCGILGPVLLALYFGVGFSVGLAQLPPDSTSVFTYVYPIVPAPVIFLALGTILLESSLLPRAVGYFAFGLGIAFAVVGLVGLFTTPLLTLLALSLQGLWILAAAIAWLLHSGIKSN